MLLPRAAAAGLASIIVPLYQYPPSETACWPDITAALKSAPKSTPWIFIANPNSGPVSDTSELYLRCLPSLRAVKNSPPVSIVGYVPTGYGKNPTAQVTQQVALYSRWNTFVVDPVGTPSKKKTALKVDGIFFDEVPDTPDSLGVYQMYAANARGARWAPSKKGMVIFNPGTTPDKGYYPLADLVITFESAYSEYNYANLPRDAPKSKQGVIIHSFPISAKQSMYNSVLKPLINLDLLWSKTSSKKKVAQRIGAVFITTDTLPNPYDPVGGPSLTMLAKGVGTYNKN